jgi:glyoxylase-like metal-dependent hydrolase (beta-lactamase superfamily II)
MLAFTELGDRVFTLVEPIVRVNVTLVVGDGQALLVDTLSTEAQATELARAVRAITSAPLIVVNTHHHFDHAFGNAIVAPPPTPIWAHGETIAWLGERGDTVRREAYELMLAEDPEFAEAVGRVMLRAPDHMVHREELLKVGDREVRLRWLGRGHTAGDLVAEVPDADVIIAGDLVEEGAPPAFGDAYPIAWPDTLAALRGLAGPASRIIPGHGAVVGADFLAEQHDELTALAWLIRDGHADGARPDKVAAASSLTRFGEAGLREATLAAIRGYSELDAAL